MELTITHLVKNLKQHTKNDLFFMKLLNHNILVIDKYL